MVGQSGGPKREQKWELERELKQWELERELKRWELKRWELERELWQPDGAHPPKAC